jgi:hypothetical protein
MSRQNKRARRFPWGRPTPAEDVAAQDLTTAGILRRWALEALTRRRRAIERREIWPRRVSPDSPTVFAHLRLLEDAAGRRKMRPRPLPPGEGYELQKVRVALNALAAGVRL